jgi:hypothetical protein
MATNFKPLRRLITCFAATLAILLPFSSALANAAKSGPKLPKAVCRIEIDNAHISSSILKHRKTRNVKINDAAVQCLNSKTTKYFGITYSKAIIQGKWQYAGRTQSSSIVPLKCGT